VFHPTSNILFERGIIMEETLNFLGKDAGFGTNNNAAYIEINNKFILIDCRI